MKKLIGFFVLLLILIAIILFIFPQILTSLMPNNLQSNQKTTQPSPSIPTVQIGSVIYTVEIADTDAKRQQGLSGRDPLPENHGMLFTFPNRQVQAFWMKDMKFNLDMIWIDGDTIVDITENVPAPLPGETNLPIYQPKAPVTAVLEMNAGDTQKNKLQIGQRIKIQL